MGGMQFEYDEKGDKVWYFIVSLYAICLLPLTYYFWPNKKTVKIEKHPEEVLNYSPCLDKCKLLQSGQPKKFERLYSTISLILIWLIFAYFLFKVFTIQHETNEYDPYAILQIDRGATVNEIKVAYRTLSRTHHPDKGGDPETFQRIIVAYKALTDNETRSNWEKYGNPDGPGVTQFGIALPKWIVEEKNSAIVLSLYILLFIIILPVGVSLWWYRSIKFTSDRLLVDTSHIFSVFLMKTPCMNIKRIIMVLSGALEFNKSHNSKIIENPEDEREIPKLLKEFSFLKENCREKPLCFPYSIKARVLIHAYLSHINLHFDYLKQNQFYIIKLCPFLLNEMIQIAVQLITFCNLGQLPRSPNLSTLENIMKLSQLIIQGCDEKKSPLLQLPHINEHTIRFFSSRHINSMKKLAALSDTDRRSLLRQLTDEQYNELNLVLDSMPYVTMTVKSEVVDDDNSHIITSGALVTLTVTLKRKSLCKMSGSADMMSSVEGGEDDTEPPTTRAAAAASTPPRASRVVSNRKSVGSGRKNFSNKINNKLSLSHRHDDESIQNHRHQDSSSTDEDEVNEEKEEENDDEDDDILDKFKEEQKKRDQQSENKSKISHRVFCPFYPALKYECWWLYVIDKKTHNLISAPVYVTSLYDSLNVEIKFTAPAKVGSYIYAVVLRSDSYLDLDVLKELKLYIHAAPSVIAEPLWESSDGEEKIASSSKSNEDEFTTETSDDE